MAGSVRVYVFVLVEDDFQAPPKGIGDAAQRGEARDMIATLETRDHGLGHLQSLGELLLSLASMGTKLQQAMGALRGNDGALV